MSDVLLETVEDGVAVLTLNRPESLNALNPPLMRALLEAVRHAAHNDEIGCVVVTGAGRGFCAGGDTKASAQAASQAQSENQAAAPKRSFEYRVDWLRRSMESAQLLHDMGKPTIAMINGPCAGAGMSLAGACDLRVAGASAVMTMAFIRGGLSGDYGASWFWTKILGSARTRELFFLSERLTAAEALTAGLVNRVYEDGELRERTMEIARRLANGPRAAFRYAKQNINLAENGSLESVLDREAVTMLLSRQALMAGRKGS